MRAVVFSATIASAVPAGTPAWLSLALRSWSEMNRATGGTCLGLDESPRPGAQDAMRRISTARFGDSAVIADPHP